MRNLNRDTSQIFNIRYFLIDKNLGSVPKLILLIMLCFVTIVQAANVVTIDGVAKDGLTISITTQFPSPTPPAPQPIPTPIPPAPQPIPKPIGQPGSKTNPHQINKPTNKIANGYISSISPDNGRGAVKVPAGAKVYFEVDTFATTKRSVIGFGVSIKFYSGMGAVCKLTQDKATLAYSSEVCQGYTSFSQAVYDNQPYEVDNTRFLYAIDNSEGGSAADDEIWATIP